MLGDFLLGAGGNGLLNLQARQNQLSDIQAQRADADENRRLDRIARYGSDGSDPYDNARQRIADMKDDTAREKLASGGAGSGASRGGKGGAAFVTDDQREAATVQLMKTLGKSRPEAQALIEASLSGQNPYYTPGRGPTEDGGVEADMPDMEKYVALNKQVGQAIDLGYQRTAGAANSEHVAKADNERAVLGYSQAAGEPKANVGMLSTQGLILGQKPLYNNIGSDGVFNVSTGGQSLNAVGTSAANKNNAAAGAEGALAGERREQSATIKDKREGTGSIKDDLSLVQGQRVALGQQLQDLRAQEADFQLMRNPEAAAAVKARRVDLERQSADLDAQYKKLGGLLDQKRNAGKSAAQPPAAPPAPAASPQAAVPDMAAAQQVRADFASGKLTRDQAKAKLLKLGFK